MNSSGSKRYLAAQPERIVKGDWKVFDISNANVIFTADEDWCATVAHGYNHFYCLPNKPNKYFVMNFLAVYNSLTQNNGASYNLHTRTLNPDAGYMVAIPGFEKIVDIPKDLNEFQDVVTSYCINREMWDKIISNPDNTYLGFWINEGKLYIDLTENIPAKDSAITIGHERNQIAIYDCYQRHDIRLRIC
jgi:hypothetical protein